MLKIILTLIGNKYACGYINKLNNKHTFCSFPSQCLE